MPLPLFLPLPPLVVLRYGLQAPYGSCFKPEGSWVVFRFGDRGEFSEELARNVSQAAALKMALSAAMLHACIERHRFGFAWIKDNGRKQYIVHTDWCASGPGRGPGKGSGRGIPPTSDPIGGRWWDGAGWRPGVCSRRRGSGSPRVGGHFAVQRGSTHRWSASRRRAGPKNAV